MIQQKNSLDFEDQLSTDFSTDHVLDLTQEQHKLFNVQQQPCTASELTAWATQTEVIRYKAQQIVNQLGPNAKNAYKLFKSQGIAVSWPNFWERRQIRKEKTRLKRQADLEYGWQAVLVNDYEAMQQALADYDEMENNHQRVRPIGSYSRRSHANGYIVAHNRNVAMHPEIAKRLGYERRDLL